MSIGLLLKLWLCKVLTKRMKWMAVVLDFYWHFLLHMSHYVVAICSWVATVLHIIGLWQIFKGTRCKRQQTMMALTLISSKKHTVNNEHVICLKHNTEHNNVHSAPVDMWAPGSQTQGWRSTNWTCEACRTVERYLIGFSSWAPAPLTMFHIWPLCHIHLTIGRICELTCMETKQSKYYNYAKQRFLLSQSGTSVQFFKKAE